MGELEVFSVPVVNHLSTVEDAFCPLKVRQCDNATEHLKGETDKSEVLPIASTLLEVNVKIYIGEHQN